MSHLFSPLQIRSVQFRNRIGVSPMCMYSAEEGVPNDWHMVHLGSRAVGGAALVIAEATSVQANGRISPADTGIWNDEQAAAWAPIAAFIEKHSAVPGIQLAHAGRKAGTDVPWSTSKPLLDLGWDIVGPSAIPFNEGYATPREMTVEDIQALIQAFKDAASRALKAGFKVIEIHGAHGYLLNSFLSPLTNQRTDAYGGSFENRTRLIKEVATSIREVWPHELPLFARFSASDWVEGGWTIEDSVRLASELKEFGVDLIDASSGGNSHLQKIPVEPGYQVKFAEAIRRQAGILTGAVGLITEPHQAEEIIVGEKADMVFIARELLRDPYWPRRAASELQRDIDIPDQYKRAW